MYKFKFKKRYATIIYFLISSIVVLSIGYLIFKMGENRGEIIGFKKQFIHTAAMYNKSKMNEIIKLPPLKIKLDHRGLVKQLTVSSYHKSGDSQKSFSNILYKVHSNILSSLSETLQFSRVDSARLLSIYDSIHPGISIEYHQLYTNALESRIKTAAVQERKAYHAADQFNATISESFCNLISIVTTLIVMKGIQKITFKEVGSEALFHTLCPELLNSIFPDLSMSLREAGAYIDMINTEVFFDDYVRKSIAEIATVKEVIRDLKVKKRLERKVLEGYKIRKLIRGAFDSEAVVEVSATAIVKAGIDIDDYFAYKVYSDQALIELTIGQPKVLSREIFPNFSKVQSGYLIKADEALVNDAKDALLLKVEQKVNTRALLDKAKTNFEQFFEAVILPTLRQNGIRNVRFKYIDSNNPPDVKNGATVMK